MWRAKSSGWFDDLSLVEAGLPALFCLPHALALLYVRIQISFDGQAPRQDPVPLKHLQHHVPGLRHVTAVILNARGVDRCGRARFDPQRYKPECGRGDTVAKLASELV